jgi:hypothetical protein
MSVAAIIATEGESVFRPLWWGIANAALNRFSVLFRRIGAIGARGFQYAGFGIEGLGLRLDRRFLPMALFYLRGMTRNSRASAGQITGTTMLIQ